jgi:hypothetical protein
MRGSLVGSMDGAVGGCTEGLDGLALIYFSVLFLILDPVDTSFWDVLLFCVCLIFYGLLNLDGALGQIQGVYESCFLFAWGGMTGRVESHHLLLLQKYVE